MDTGVHRGSSHRCIGGWDVGVDASSTGTDLESVDAPFARLARNQKERTCLFRQVCFSNGSWVYFAKGDEFRGQSRAQGGIDIWARGDFGHQADFSVDHTFALRHSPLPANVQWIGTPTVVKLAALAPGNFGHLLGNALYPAFVAVWRLFGERAVDLPVQLLFAGHNQADPARVLQKCGRKWASQTAVSPAAVAHCYSHASLVSKFVRQLLAGVADAPLLWEEELAQTSRRRPGGLVCARQLIVGTGDLGFSTIHRLANSSLRRRPAQPLWGVFIDRLLKRLDQIDDSPSSHVAATSHGSSGQLARAARLAWATHARPGGRMPMDGSASSGPPSSSGSQPLGAVLIVKHGRRALLREEYAALQLQIERVLGMAVLAIDAGRMPLRLQFAHIRRAAIGISNDGGSSMVLNFLPRGGALVVLGSFERWLWVNDGRLRAFYCQPWRREARLGCPPVDGAPHLRLSVPSGGCYALNAMLPCVEAMLRRALLHVRLTWPA